MIDSRSGAGNAYGDPRAAVMPESEDTPKTNGVMSQGRRSTLRRLLRAGEWAFCIPTTITAKD